MPRVSVVTAAVVVVLGGLLLSVGSTTMAVAAQSAFLGTTAPEICLLC